MLANRKPQKEMTQSDRAKEETSYVKSPIQ